jgi:hypothetical protein
MTHGLLRTATVTFDLYHLRRSLCRRTIHLHGVVLNTVFFKKKALTVLRGPLAYPNGLLDLHILETYGRTPWPGDQPDARQHIN